MSITQLETRLAGPPGQPEIGYTPDPVTYRLRVEKRQKEEKLPTTVPAGFPEKLESPLVWDGATVSDTYKWSYELTESDIKEVDDALKSFQSTFICSSNLKKVKKHSKA